MLNLKEMRDHQCPMKIKIDHSDNWVEKHVNQSQYMLQIVKWEDETCRKPWRTNYREFFPGRFLPPPIPLAAVKDGLAILDKGRFRSLFQTLHIISVKGLSTACYDKFYPSLNKIKKGKTMLEKRTCAHCKQYFSTVQQNESHQRKCSSKPVKPPRHKPAKRTKNIK